MYNYNHPPCLLNFPTGKFIYFHQQCDEGKGGPEDPNIRNIHSSQPHSVLLTSRAVYSQIFLLSLLHQATLECTES